MPNSAYQVVKKILEFSFLNEKEIFSDLQFVPVSTIFKLLLVSWTQVIQAPEIAPALQFLAFTCKVLATRTLTVQIYARLRKAFCHGASLSLPLCQENTVLSYLQILEAEMLLLIAKANNQLLHKVEVSTEHLQLWNRGLDCMHQAAAACLPPAPNRANCPAPRTHTHVRKERHLPTLFSS